jgi:hypothetical protein
MAGVVLSDMGPIEFIFKTHFWGWDDLSDLSDLWTTGTIYPIYGRRERFMDDGNDLSDLWTIYPIYGRFMARR